MFFLSEFLVNGIKIQLKQQVLFITFLLAYKMSNKDILLFLGIKYYLVAGATKIFGGKYY